MALTFTVAALQTELSNYGEAMALSTAAGYVTARAALRKARAIRMGLADVSEGKDASTTLPNIQWFAEAEAAITAAETATTTTTADRRRRISVGFGGDGR